MNNPTEAFYNKFSALYPLVDAFLASHKKALFTQINALPQGNVLEIGVGNGSHLRLYKKHRVTGIDTSAAMLEIARRKNSTSIELIKMDGQMLLFADDQFDYVVLSHVIAVVDDPGQLLMEVLRVLKPSGRVFILNHFTPRNWIGYLDRAFTLFARSFHFRSVFNIDDISAINNFHLLKEIPLGPAAYFKLLIYQKIE